MRRRRQQRKQPSFEEAFKVLIDTLKQEYPHLTDEQAFKIRLLFTSDPNVAIAGIGVSDVYPGTESKAPMASHFPIYLDPDIQNDVDRLDGFIMETDLSLKKLKCQGRSLWYVCYDSTPVYGGYSINILNPMIETP